LDSPTLTQVPKPRLRRPAAPGRQCGILGPFGPDQLAGDVVDDDQFGRRQFVELADNTGVQLDVSLGLGLMRLPGRIARNAFRPWSTGTAPPRRLPIWLKAWLHGRCARVHLLVYIANATWTQPKSGKAYAIGIEWIASGYIIRRKQHNGPIRKTNKKNEETCVGCVALS
jgi:hypothetical protein